MENKAKPKKKNKALSVISTILLIIVIIFAIALAGVRLIGITPYTVLSGSMEPTYHVGSLVYVKKADYKTLKAGDPITFMLNEDTIATHRIIEVVSDPEDPETIRFRTQGDANENPDSGLVHYKNVIGKVSFSIPYLGYVANFVQKPPGLYVGIAVIVLVILLMFLPDILGGDGKKKKQEEQS